MVRLRLLSILAIGFAVALSAQQTPSPLIPRTHEGGNKGITPTTT